MKTCFVIQGFGKKTDYPTSRVLDLDASYEVIKAAVEAAGLECIRADEIVHSGTIDVPMYRMLLEADLVIADLSTYNVNAAFELGVRYALRPGTTILIAEEKFANPFDVSHIAITRYQHLGDDVGAREARRIQKVLVDKIRSLTANPTPDSPVYTFLPDLSPPSPAKMANSATLSADSPALLPSSPVGAPGAPSPGSNAVPSNAKSLLDEALDMINPPAGKPSDFVGAQKNLREVLKIRPTDSFVLQQLALATYKSKQPSNREALETARQILEQLDPGRTSDPETLGLWGAVHKRLWEESGRSEDLAQSVRSYQRGFIFKQDHYNGINLAYLLNQQAILELKAGNREEAIAYKVEAQRVRRDVISYATTALGNAEKGSDAYFWIVATLWEAHLGLKDQAGMARWQQEADSMKAPDWQQETRRNQGAQLQSLLAQYDELFAKTA